MKTPKDYTELVGIKFGSLTVIRVTNERNDRHEMLLECACDCGGSWTGPYPRLKSGNTKSCGCLQPAVASASGKTNTTHGGSKTLTYASHRSMMRRCYEEGTASYAAYGGKGVKVCDRWRGVENYQNFRDDMGERPKGMTLDRYPNGKGDYEPGNCRWATPAQQARNFSSNHWITVNGETLVVTDWALRLGVTPTTILDRLKRGYSEEDAVTLPADPRNTPMMVTLHGEEITLIEVAKRYSIDIVCLKGRLVAGKSIEEAVKTPSRGNGNKGKKVLVDGVAMSYAEIAAMTGLSYAVVLYRVKREWPTDALLNTPSQKKTRCSETVE